MQPHLPDRLLPQLHAALSPGMDSAIFKLQLGHDGTVYGVEIDRQGVIRHIQGRYVSVMADLHFSPSDVTNLERYSELK